MNNDDNDNDDAATTAAAAKNMNSKVGRKTTVWIDMDVTIQRKPK